MRPHKCGFISVGFGHRLVIVLHGVEVVMLGVFAGFIATRPTARTTDWRRRTTASTTDNCTPSSITSSTASTVRRRGRMGAMSASIAVPVVWTAGHGVVTTVTLPLTMIGLRTLPGFVGLVCLSLHLFSRGVISIIVYLL